MKKKWSVLSLLCLCAVAIAGTISINAASAPYSSAPAINSVDYTAEWASIQAGVYVAVNIYNGLHGQTTTPSGTQVIVTWKDSSKTTATVVDSKTVAGILITQTTPPPTTPTGGGSGDSGSGGGTGGGGGSPPTGDCIGACSGKVVVGPIIQ